MAITKSGISTPTDPPKKPIEAPVKHYPGSGSLGKGADSSGKGGKLIDGPLKGKGNTD